MAEQPTEHLRGDLFATFWDCLLVIQAAEEGKNDEAHRLLSLAERNRRQRQNRRVER